MSAKGEALNDDDDQGRGPSNGAAMTQSDGVEDHNDDCEQTNEGTVPYARHRGMGLV